MIVFAVGEGFFVGEGFWLSCLVGFLWMFLGGFFVDVFWVTFYCVGFGLFGKMVEQGSPLKRKIEQRKLEKRSGKYESKALAVVRHDDTKMHEGTVGRIGWLGSNFDTYMWCIYNTMVYNVDVVPVISRVITALVGVMTPVTHL